MCVGRTAVGKRSCWLENEGRERGLKCLSEGCLYSAITTLCECQAGGEI